MYDISQGTATLVDSRRWVDPCESWYTLLKINRLEKSDQPWVIFNYFNNRISLHSEFFNSIADDTLFAMDKSNTGNSSKFNTKCNF